METNCITIETKTNRTTNSMANVFAVGQFKSNAGTHDSQRINLSVLFAKEKNSKLKLK